MREWGEFPAGDVLPTHIPRLWFNWGPWCSPVAAVPALGSQKFIAFARSQLAAGVLEPLVARLGKWSRNRQEYLFAGINIGWEIHFPDYNAAWLRAANRNQPGPVLAECPPHLKGLAMDERSIGLRLGYASLHWRGWNEVRLAEAAIKDGIPRDEKFRRLCYESIHAYMDALAKECADHSVPPDRIYTHIVALATVKDADLTIPPVWTAVNRYSTPGFTMDQKGAARFDLETLKREIANAPGSRRSGFGAVESYFGLNGRNYIADADSYRKELDGLFDAGARVKVVYGAFPLVVGRAPEPAFVAIREWLGKGKR